MPIKHADAVAVQPVAAGEKTSIQVLLSSSETPHFAMRRFTIQPGGGMPRHTNTVEHEQYVLGGKALIGLGDEEFRVSAGDVVFIPGGAPHWYRTIGDEDFVFLCLVPNEKDVITILTEC